jgi:hypothetical protein
MTFNVNVARAQRLEAKGENFYFEVDGEKFSLPTELDVDLLAKLKDTDQSDIKALLAVLMGSKKDSDRLFRHKLSVQDCHAITTAWREETGASVGEDSASAS